MYLCSVNLETVSCDYLSCFNDTCIEESKCSEVNCYSWGQICDKIVDCPESGADEVGCAQGEGDRAVKMQRSKFQNLNSNLEQS